MKECKNVKPEREKKKVDWVEGEKSDVCLEYMGKESVRRRSEKL